jgi:hypothetical protein
MDFYNGRNRTVNSSQHAFLSTEYNSSSSEVIWCLGGDDIMESLHRSIVLAHCIPRRAGLDLAPV